MWKDLGPTWSGGGEPGLEWVEREIDREGS